MPDTPPRAQLDPDNGSRGFLISIGSLVSARAFLSVSQILVLPIIARQLEVEDFAIMALAMVVVVFAQTLSDSGLGRSLIRRADYDHEEWSSVFWLMVIMGLVLAVITAAMGPLLAVIYDDSRFHGLLAALALVPLFQAIAAAPSAEIERREDFTGIARVQMTTTVLSLGLAVSLALLGAGVWALVAQQLALAGLRLALTVHLSSFRPSWTFRREKLKSHVVFARDTLSVSVLDVARRQMIFLVAGRAFSTVQVGYLAMSHRFSRLPQFGLAGPMTSVVFVRMAKVQDSPERLAEIYLASMRLLALVLIVPMSMLAVAGGSVFSIFLGEEWRPIWVIFALSIGGLVMEAIALFLLRCLFRAVSRTDLLVRLAFEGLMLQFLLIIPALYSVEALAFSMTVWAFLMVPRGWAMARRLVPLGWIDCLMVFAPGCAVAAGLLLAFWQVTTRIALSDIETVALAIALGLGGLAIEAIMDWSGLRRAISALRSDLMLGQATAPSAAE